MLNLHYYNNYYAGMTNLVTLLQGALIGLTSATEAFIDILKFHDG